MKRIRRISFLVVVMVVIIGITMSLYAAGQTESTMEGTEGATTYKVAMAAAGARGDEGIFDLGWKGMQDAQKDLGVEIKVFEGEQNPALYSNRLISAVEWADLIFVNPGYQFESDLAEVMEAYPEKVFVYVDGVSQSNVPNLVSVAYRENEGSYPFGVMAALMTSRTEIEGINDKKVVGIVGAMDIPTINNFVAGFKQGAASVDPDVKVEVRYAGSFGDPAKGLELAKSLYDLGADIVFNVAATTGLGVLKAAAETGLYAIGVDVNQDNYQPGHVLGSMLKRVDTSFYDVIDAYVAGTLEGNEVMDYGLTQGWVSPSYSVQMKELVPADIIAKMEAAQKDVVNGKIIVDSTR